MTQKIEDIITFNALLQGCATAMILGMVCHQVDPNHLQPPKKNEEMVCRPRGLDRNDINAGWWKPHYRGWRMIWGKYWKKTGFQRALDRSWCSSDSFFWFLDIARHGKCFKEKSRGNAFPSPPGCGVQAGSKPEVRPQNFLSRFSCTDHQQADKKHW